MTQKIIIFIISTKSLIMKRMIKFLSNRIAKGVKSDEVQTITLAFSEIVFYLMLFSTEITLSFLL